MKLQDKLKKLRGSISMTQLAKDSAIPQSSLSEIEAGKTEPKTKTLLALADYFKVPVEYLLRDDIGTLTEPVRPFPVESNKVVQQFSDFDKPVRVKAKTFPIDLSPELDAAVMRAARRMGVYKKDWFLLAIRHELERTDG